MGPYSRDEVLVGTIVCYFEWNMSRTDRTSTNQRMAMKGPKRKETHPRTKSKKPKSGRESIESFVVVFLCFLIWSLEAEGFVIPTGSMAPTLMGRHKEIACPECGYLYTVNADREIAPTANENNASRRIRSGTCENCRFEASVVDAPELFGRSHLRDERRALPAVFRRPLAASSSSDGMWPSSNCPKSLKSATSSVWSACPTK